MKYLRLFESHDINIDIIKDIVNEYVDDYSVDLEVKYLNSAGEFNAFNLPYDIPVFFFNSTFSEDIKEISNKLFTSGFKEIRRYYLENTEKEIEILAVEEKNLFIGGVKIDFNPSTKIYSIKFIVLYRDEYYPRLYNSLSLFKIQLM